MGMAQKLESHSEIEYLDSEAYAPRKRSRDGEDWLEQTLDEEDIVPLNCSPVSTTLCLDDICERTGLL